MIQSSGSGVGLGARCYFMCTVSCWVGVGSWFTPTDTVNIAPSIHWGLENHIYNLQVILFGWVSLVTTMGQEEEEEEVYKHGSSTLGWVGLDDGSLLHVPRKYSLAPNHQQLGLGDWLYGEVIPESSCRKRKIVCFELRGWLLAAFQRNWRYAATH